jgi:hypothetical protein
VEACPQLCNVLTVFLSPEVSGFSRNWNVKISQIPCQQPYTRENGNPHLDQGCQMVSFQTKNPNLDKFWRALDRKMLMYFMTIWNILQTLRYFMTIWYTLYSFGTFFPVLVSCNKKNLATLA